MRKAPRKKHDDEDIVQDSDLDEAIVVEEDETAAHGLQGKVKKLQTELAKVKKERDDNLAGWQRSRADLVNYRRMVEEDRAREAARAKAELLRSLISVMDSFESAMTSSTWDTVDKEWREGVERIHGQLAKVFASQGLIGYGTEGDPFDPMLHECMSVVPTDDASKDLTLAQVFQRGYRIGEEVVRPAKVVVAQTG